MSILFPIFCVFIVLPITYFAGYKLRKRLSPNRRFVVGCVLSSILVVTTIILEVQYPSFEEVVNGIGLAILIGSLGGVGMGDTKPWLFREKK